VAKKKDDTPIGPTGRPYQGFAIPKPLSSHGPARIIALCNQKGGVGKTTTTINLAASIAEYGRTVLVVDFDPQGAATVGLGVSPYDLDKATTVYDLIMARDPDPAEAIKPTVVPGVEVMPANIQLSAAEVYLVNEVAREQVLARALRPVLGDYDVVLIDCQPSLGLLTVNALTAAHGVLIPLVCEYLSLRGVGLLKQTTIDKVADRLNPRLRIDGILATMFDARTLHTREMITTVYEEFGDTLLQTTIPRTVKLPDATIATEPITTYAPEHASAKAYRQLARELIARGAAA
jgi:chromosome partitioning protein